MEGADVFERVRPLLAKKLELDVDEIRLESRLVEDLEVDSLDMLELVLVLRDEFGITVPDGEVKELLSELAPFVSDRVQDPGENVDGLTDEERLLSVARAVEVRHLVNFIASRAPNSDISPLPGSA